MHLTISGSLFSLSGILLGYFSYTRLRAWKLDPHNTINLYYWKATFLITCALMLYGFAGLFFENSANFLRITAAFATVINILGFGYFLLIPVYSWGSARAAVIARGGVRLYALVVAALLNLYPPQSFIDHAGIIHWRFSTLIGWLALIIMGVAFTLNIILLSSYFKRLASLSFVNLIALIATFFLTGIGGSYLYIGDNAVFLVAASFFLFAGICSVFWSVVKSAIQKQKKR